MAFDPALWRLMSERWVLLSSEDLSVPQDTHVTREFYVEKYHHYQRLQGEAHEIEVPFH